MSTRAYLVQDHESFFGDKVRLHVVTTEIPGTLVGRAYLREDGQWQKAEEGTRMGDSGIVLPAEAVEAIAVAIAQFQGHTSHADTEARVLREWLAVEQRRVDEALTK